MKEQEAKRLAGLLLARLENMPNHSAHVRPLLCTTITTIRPENENREQLLKLICRGATNGGSKSNGNAYICNSLIDKMTGFPGNKKFRESVIERVESICNEAWSDTVRIRFIAGKNYMKASFTFV